jgi:hypothetical protein
MALRTLNLPSGRLKCVIGDVDEAMFQGVKKPFYSLSILLSIKKSDLKDVAKVMFQVGEWS